jgi:glyoxylase-like metal-dependent hydrolase (beta-lactamase superfamily II)
VDCFAVVTERYLVVVDTFGSPQEAQQMMGLLKTDLVGRQLLVINTHQHYDHAWGNGVFAEGGPYPAPIIGHQKSLELLLTRGQEATDYLAQKQSDPRFASVQIVAPSLGFSQGLTIHGGDLSLELIPAPGHSPDQIVVWIPQIKTLLAADALEYPFPYAENPQDLPLLLQTLRRLKKLGAATLLPCHGGIHGPELVQQNLEYFASLNAACQQALSNNQEPSTLLPYESVMEWMNLKASQFSDIYRDFHQRNLQAATKLMQRGGSLPLVRSP